MSIQDQRLFVKNEETQAVAKDGSFSKDTAGNQTYRFTLKTSADTSASGKVDSMDSG